MKMSCLIPCLLIVILLHISSAQLPPRFQIPGAVLVQGARPATRQQRINALNTDFVPRLRRPTPSAAPIREIRPVVEEEEDFPPSASPSISGFDAEVNKLSIPAITSAVRQAEEEEELQQTARPSPLPFRPERPVPVSRDQIREKPSLSDFQPARPSPQPALRPLPVFRQEPRPLPSISQNRPLPAPRPIRPVVRQELDADEEENIPRQPIRQKVRQQNSQGIAQQFRPAPRPKTQFDEDDVNRKRKPVVQILRKYRTDNEDGSITWGFENDDGTFKEETLGTDCVTKGKYGYVDPDGVKREFTYETGNKCDQRDEEDLEDEEIAPRLPPPKRPSNAGKPQQPQIQYRPQLAQY